jgi:hypothetical protein
LDTLEPFEIWRAKRDRSRVENKPNPMALPIMVLGLVLVLPIMLPSIVLALMWILISSLIKMFKKIFKHYFSALFPPREFLKTEFEKTNENLFLFKDIALKNLKEFFLINRLLDLLIELKWDTELRKNVVGRTFLCVLILMTIGGVLFISSVVSHLFDLSQVHIWRGFLHYWWIIFQVCKCICELLFSFWLISLSFGVGNTFFEWYETKCIPYSRWSDLGWIWGCLAGLVFFGCCVFILNHFFPISNWVMMGGRYDSDSDLE